MFVLLLHLSSDKIRFYRFKIILSSKSFGPSVFLDPNILDPKKIVLKENADPKKLLVNKNVRSKMFQKVLVWKIVWSKKIWVEQNYGPIKLGPQKTRPKKIVENLFGNNWDIPDMDKCHHEKCCLYKCHHDSWNLFKMVPGTYL